MSVQQTPNIRSGEFYPKTLNIAQFILLHNKYYLFMLYLTNSQRIILAVDLMQEYLPIK